MGVTFKKLCPECGNSFEGNRIFCSRLCRWKYSLNNDSTVLSFFEDVIL